MPTPLSRLSPEKLIAEHARQAKRVRGEDFTGHWKYFGMRFRAGSLSMTRAQFQNVILRMQALPDYVKPPAPPLVKADEQYEVTLQKDGATTIIKKVDSLVEAISEAAWHGGRATNEVYAALLGENVGVWRTKAEAIQEDSGSTALAFIRKTT